MQDAAAATTSSAYSLDRAIYAPELHVTCYAFSAATSELWRARAWPCSGAVRMPQRDMTKTGADQACEELSLATLVVAHRARIP